MDDLKEKANLEEGAREDGSMSEELQEKLKKLDKESNTVEYGGIWAKIIAYLCIAFSLFQLYTGLVGTFDAMIQRAVHLSFGISLVYLLCPTKRSRVKGGSVQNLRRRQSQCVAGRYDSHLRRGQLDKPAIFRSRS